MVIAAGLRFSDIPVQPSREQARAWAASELAHREYQQGRPGLLARALDWLLEQLSGLHPADARLGSMLSLLLVVLLLGLIVWAVHRAGGVRRNRTARADPTLGGVLRTAAEHRAEADRLSAAGDWPAAVLERFRAIARRLEEQAVLVPQPGRTADEVAAEAALWLPALAERLTRAAQLFDAVRYGGRSAGPADDANLRQLDAALAEARPIDLVAANG